MTTENGEVNFTTALKEEILRPEDDHPDVVPPFNAYSAQGEPEVVGFLESTHIQYKYTMDHGQFDMDNCNLTPFTFTAHAH